MTTVFVSNLLMPCALGKTVEGHSSGLLATSFAAYLSTDEFTDLTILCQNGSRHVHKAIVAANSLYFHTMFKMSLQDVIITTSLPMFKLEMFDIVLDYFYGKSIKLNVDNVESVLEIADMLWCPKLLDVCARYLKSDALFRPEFILKIFHLAATYNLTKLEESCIIFIEYCLPTLSTKYTADFNIYMTKDILWKILDSDRNRTGAQDIYFEPALKWINSDLEGRAQYLYALINHPRFPKDDIDYIKFLANCKTCCDNKICASEVANWQQMYEAEPPKKTHRHCRNRCHDPNGFLGHANKCPMITFRHKKFEYES